MSLALRSRLSKKWGEKARKKDEEDISKEKNENEKDENEEVDKREEGEEKEEEIKASVQEWTRVIKRG